MKIEALIDRAINTFFEHPIVVAAITAGKMVTICPAHRCVMVCHQKETKSDFEFWIDEVWGHGANARACAHSNAIKCWGMLNTGEIQELLYQGKGGIVRISKPEEVKGSHPEYYLMALHILNNNPFAVKRPRQFT